MLDWLSGEMAQGRLGTVLGRGYQAVIFLYRGPFGEVVVKRPHASPLLRALGRRAVRREHAIYRRIAGIEGVPACLGMLEGDCLVLEHVSGMSLRRGDQRIGDRQTFFAKLLATIEKMHAAGVAHGDLKRKDNILIGPGEQPYVIDFGIAWREREPRTRLNTAVFEWFKQADYNAWIKLKYRRRVVDIAPEDAAYHRPLLLEKIARSIRVPYQKLTLRRWRKRRRDLSVEPNEQGEP
jgi:serine/threonine protein kinase